MDEQLVLLQPAPPPEYGGAVRMVMSLVAVLAVLVFVGWVVYLTVALVAWASCSDRWEDCYWAEVILGMVLFTGAGAVPLGIGGAWGLWALRRGRTSAPAASAEPPSAPP